MDNQRSRRRPSLLSDMERHGRGRSMWLGEQPDGVSPKILTHQHQLQQQQQQHHQHHQAQSQHHINLQHQVVAATMAAHPYTGLAPVVAMPHVQTVAVATSPALPTIRSERGLMGANPIVQAIGNIQTGLVMPNKQVAAIVAATGGQSILTSTPAHQPAAAAVTGVFQQHQPASNLQMAHDTHGVPLAAVGRPSTGPNVVQWPGQHQQSQLQQSVQQPQQQLQQQSPSKPQLNHYRAANTAMLSATNLLSSADTGGISAPPTKTVSHSVPRTVGSSSCAVSTTAVHRNDSVPLPTVEAVSPASGGEDDSDNDSIVEHHHASGDGGAARVRPASVMGTAAATGAAVSRKVNTPSPQHPIHSRDYLMSALVQLDGEILKFERKMSKLKELKKGAESRENSQQDTCTSSDLQGNFIDRIYAENKRKAQEAHSTLGAFCLNIESAGPGGLYKEPSDLEVYHEILNNRHRVQPKLVKYLRLQHEEQRSKDLELCEQYQALTQAWGRKIETYENNSRKRAKDAKSREVFEKHFPDLKRQRERSQRITRLGSRGTYGGAARSEAELTEILDSLAEMEEMENPDRCRQGAAVIPPMVGLQDKHRIRFVNRNSVIQDPITFAKEWQQRTVWTDEEKETFRQKYVMFPKVFDKIASFLPEKSVKECVLYYYRSKKSEKYKRLARKYSKRFRQQQRLQSHQQEQEKQLQLLEKQRQQQNEERQRQQEANTNGNGSAPSATASSTASSVAITNKWSDNEVRLLKDGIVAHGHEWELVAKVVQSRGAEDCKMFYHRHGRHCHLQYALRTHRNRQKRQAAAALLEAAAAAEQTEGVREETDTGVVAGAGIGEDETENEESTEAEMENDDDVLQQGVVSAAMPAPYVHNGPERVDVHAVDLVLAVTSEVANTCNTELPSSDHDFSMYAVSVASTTTAASATATIATSATTTPVTATSSATASAAVSVAVTATTTAGSGGDELMQTDDRVAAIDSTAILAVPTEVGGSSVRPPAADVTHFGSAESTEPSAINGSEHTAAASTAATCDNAIPVVVATLATNRNGGKSVDEEHVSAENILATAQIPLMISPLSPVPSPVTEARAALGTTQPTTSKIQHPTPYPSEMLVDSHATDSQEPMDTSPVQQRCELSESCSPSTLSLEPSKLTGDMSGYETPAPSQESLHSLDLVESDSRDIHTSSSVPNSPRCKQVADSYVPVPAQEIGNENVRQMADENEESSAIHTTNLYSPVSSLTMDEDDAAFEFISDENDGDEAVRSSSSSSSIDQPRPSSCSFETKGQLVEDNSSSAICSTSNTRCYADAVSPISSSDTRSDDMADDADTLPATTHTAEQHGYCTTPSPTTHVTSEKTPLKSPSLVSVAQLTSSNSQLPPVVGFGRFSPVSPVSPVLSLVSDDGCASGETALEQVAAASMLDRPVSVSGQPCASPPTISTTPHDSSIGKANSPEADVSLTAANNSDGNHGDDPLLLTASPLNGSHSSTSIMEIVSDYAPASSPTADASDTDSADSMARTADTAAAAADDDDEQEDVYIHVTSPNGSNTALTLVKQSQPEAVVGNVLPGRRSSTLSVESDVRSGSTDVSNICHGITPTVQQKHLQLQISPVSCDEADNGFDEATELCSKHCTDVVPLETTHSDHASVERKSSLASLSPCDSSDGMLIELHDPTSPSELDLS
ncbi:pneumococcal serine-rich repeat protein-like isoform X2 [Sycon ciliatum]|uniref:pneumococcal serine-rich repeat protein-like isoform X2 n=1 Tax=Sycon ciliatum TaxID=27933 RepID=UPI0031F6CE3C